MPSIRMCDGSHPTLQNHSRFCRTLNHANYMQFFAFTFCERPVRHSCARMRASRAMSLWCACCGRREENCHFEPPRLFLSNTCNSINQYTHHTCNSIYHSHMQYMHHTCNSINQSIMYHVCNVSYMQLNQTILSYISTVLTLFISCVSFSSTLLKLTTGMSNGVNCRFPSLAAPGGRARGWETP